MKLNDVLLGLVKLHPGVSGYELRKIISQSTQYFMNAQLSQIYPALKQMAEAGLMRYAEEITEGGRATKRYTLTEEGERRLLESLRTPIDYTLSMNAVRLFMLKTTFVGLLPRDEQVEFLRDALDYFRYERSELMAGHIDLERAYLDDDLVQREAVTNFWEAEVAYILATQDNLIAWIEGLLGKLEG